MLRLSRSRACQAIKTLLCVDKNRAGYDVETNDKSLATLRYLILRRPQERLKHAARLSHPEARACQSSMSTR